MSQVRQAEMRATEILDELGITAIPTDLHAIATALDAEVHYEVMEDALSGLMVRRTDGSIVLAINAEHHPNRQRFSLAHEIGHRVLHSDTTDLFVDKQLLLMRHTSGGSAGDIRERAANAFAAELLMPRSRLLEDIEARELDALDDVAVRSLAQRYEVSTQALTFRLLNVGSGSRGR